MKASLDLVQVVMTLDHETRDGNLVPKLTVDDVAFQLHKDGTTITLEIDDTPVYRETQLKEAVTEWIKTSMKNREKDFK